MLTLEDCMCLSELSEDEIATIAEHEHLPPIVAAELGCGLSHSIEGRQRIWSIFHDEIIAAQAHGDVHRSVQLKKALRDFILRFASGPLKDASSRSAG